MGPPQGEAFHLLVVTGNFPNPQRPENGTFVRTFVHALADAGAEITVVVVESIWRARRPHDRGTEVEFTAAGRPVKILRRRFLSFSAKKACGLSTASLTQIAFEAVARTTAAELRPRPAAVYGHFLYPSGAAAMKIGASLRIPAFVAVGEGTFWTVEHLGDARARRDFHRSRGFLAVSTPIADGLARRFGFPQERIAVFPNGTDRSKFKPGDRGTARAALGIPQDLFVVIFVGTFDELKGGRKLLEAARGMKDTGLLLLGGGPVPLDGPEVLFKGRVGNDQIPNYLAAADVFALPTLEEGSCNAVVEALACGLPVLTARGAYMRDLVDEACAVMVDPMSVQEIRAGLERLRTDPGLRSELSRGALKRAESLDVRVRAGAVLDWLKEKVARG